MGQATLPSGEPPTLISNPFPSWACLAGCSLQEWSHHHPTCSPSRPPSFPLGTSAVSPSVALPVSPQQLFQLMHTVLKLWTAKLAAALASVRARGQHSRRRNSPFLTAAVWTQHDPTGWRSHFWQTLALSSIKSPMLQPQSPLLSV